MTGKVHIIGAGLAGLAAALRFADEARAVAIHEAAPQAGGRCRSYFDSSLGMTIDNGNHLLLSGNRAALDFLREIGSEAEFVGPGSAEFSFLDLTSGETWRLRPNDGPIPWWILQSGRRVPGTRAADYLDILRLLFAPQGAPIKAALNCRGLLYERLWRPFFLAALNTAPEEGAASLAAAILRETLAKGGQACRPLVALNGLSSAFIAPALRHLESKNVQIFFERRLLGIKFDAGRVASLDFADERIEVAAEDKVILAVPAPVAASLVPGLITPQSFRAIVNGHFKITPPAGFPPILGVINGTIEWLFAFPDRLSVTISAADGLIDLSRDELARRIWSDVARATQIAQPMPAWQIIKEKRATFAATAEEELRRPKAQTAFSNLVLAGDWTATGLPATIEGAIRSGFTAAEAIL
ncbi:MAG TPA: hydroxysqualene dehydroxylase HpnE [Methylovirgula sp.]|nr:hydroxysqualene dehydroxylase HpnE [Methylovirgula sp.]